MSDALKSLLLAVVSGGVAAAAIKVFGDGLLWRRNRKAQKEDKAEQKKEDAEKQAALHTEDRLRTIEEMMAAQSEALRYILYDRIRHLAQAYIAERYVDFDDRRILNAMHRSYHDGLGGNGDLDALMDQVNKLPLKMSK